MPIQPARQGYFDIPFSTFETSSKDWAAASSFIFPGSDLAGTPVEVKAIAGRVVNGVNTKVRIYDVTNAALIAESEWSLAEYPAIVSLTITPENIPAGEAVWEVQIQRNTEAGNKKVSVSSLQLRF